MAIQFPVLVCSRNGSINVSTAVVIADVAILLGRQLNMITAEGAGTAIGRNELSKKYAAGKKNFFPRVLLLDDDIRIEWGQQEYLANLIKEADSKGYNFVAPYRLLRQGADGVRWDIMHYPGAKGYENWEKSPDQLSYSDYAVAKMKDFDVFDGYAGLGFYYGVLPTDYLFVEGHENGGEDARFFWENGELINGLRLVHLKLNHLKAKWI